MNVHVSRNVSAERIMTLSPGLYTIAEVAEMESDGNITIISSGALELCDITIIPIYPSTNPGSIVLSILYKAGCMTLIIIMQNFHLSATFLRGQN